MTPASAGSASRAHRRHGRSFLAGLVSLGLALSAAPVSPAFAADGDDPLWGMLEDGPQSSEQVTSPEGTPSPEPSDEVEAPDEGAGATEPGTESDQPAGPEDAQATPSPIPTELPQADDQADDTAPQTETAPDAVPPADPEAGADAGDMPVGGPLTYDPEPRTLSTLAATDAGVDAWRPERILEVFDGIDLGDNGGYSGTAARPWNWSSAGCTATSAEGSYLRVVTICQTGQIRTALLDITGKKVISESSKPLTGTLPKLGGVYMPAPGQIFVLSGQDNPQETATLDVFRVQRFDTSLVQVGSSQSVKSSGIPGLNSSPPIPNGASQSFSAGASSMTIVGSTLFVHTNRHFKIIPGESQAHTANVTLKVPVAMNGALTASSISYYSHSFKELAGTYGDKLLLADHGDAYPRDIGIAMVTNPTAASPSVVKRALLPIVGVQGANHTGATMADLAVGGSTVAVIGRSAPQADTIGGVTGNTTKNTAGQYTSNVYMTIASLPLNGSVAPVKVWLTTNNPASSNTIVNEPTVNALSDGRYVALFAVQDLDRKTTTFEYRLVSAAGKIDKSVSVPGLGYFPSAKPQLVGNILTWIGSDEFGGGPGKLHVLNVANPANPLFLKADGRPFDQVTKPTMKGSVKVDGTVTVDMGTWSPTPTELKYQWRLNGKAITGATGPTYTPIGTDRFNDLSVSVTASASGRAPTTLTSDEEQVSAGMFMGVEPPVISGQPTVGQTLRTTNGTWSPVTPTSFGYSWKRDGVVIPGATSSTYTLVAADAGTRITVSIDARKDGYMGQYGSYTATVGPIARPDIPSAPLPTISGMTKVGSSLTAVTGSWGPGTPSFTYQWKRNGANIAGATGATYVTTTADATATMSVAVTGRLSGYADTTRVSTQAFVVDANTFASTGSLSISGTMAVGGTVTASIGTWDPTPTTVLYTWYRTDGTRIQQGTSSTYRLTSAEAGQSVYVTITAQRATYKDVIRTSMPYGPISERGFDKVGFVNLSCTAEIGKTLTAIPYGWSPAPTGYQYQWKNSKGPIPGATGASYQVRSTDAGDSVYATVTTVLSGYGASSADSPKSAVVPLGTFTASPAPVITGTVRVGQTLTATTTGWNPQPGSFSYVWMRDGQVISGAGSGASYTLTVADVGTRITVDALPNLTGYVRQPKTSAPTAVVPLATYTSTPVPQILGTLRVGSELRVEPTGWVPVPEGYSFQWLRDGVPLAGRTQSRYLLSADDVGTRITVRVTPIKDKYAPFPMLSAPTAYVPGESFTSTTTPILDGSWVWGYDVWLKAGTGTATPEPDSTTYQWLKDGVPIPGATGTSYTQKISDIGWRLSLRVTIKKAGYTTVELTSAVNPETAKRYFNGAAQPRIEGEPAVGKTLTATIGSWYPDPDSLTYQWKRAGSPITGATGRTYVPRPEDVGQNLSVTVTSHKAGYFDYWLDSVTVGPVQLAAFDSVPEPTIKGRLFAGQTLTAHPGLITPLPTSYAYQWFRDGLPIPNATRAYYTTNASEQGSSFDVLVTAKRPGYADISRGSSWTNPLAPPLVTRVSGSSRFETAAKISTHVWAGAADSTVIIATGRGFADALAAAPLGAKINAPLLLTERDSLPDATAQRIQQIQPARIIVVGGRGAVGDAVFRELQSLQANTVRISGSSRYETGRAIVRFGWPEGTDSAFIATGESFADALSAGAAAGARKIPVVLVNGKLQSIDQETGEMLRNMGARNLHIAGGTVAVSSGLESSLSWISGFEGVQVFRYKGTTKLETSANSARAFKGDLVGSVYLANSDSYADALTGAIAAGLRGAPLLLTPKGCVSPEARSLITEIKPYSVYALGGTVSLADPVLSYTRCG